MIEQKLDYIHHNPVSGKWKLTEDFVNYIHSSALFYEEGEQRSFNVVHYKDLNQHLEHKIESSESPSGDSE